MRAYDIHCHAKQVKRSEGRSSVAAAAYRAGVSLEDERTGITHDYTRKGGVEHSRIYAPNNAPDWVHDRSQLWNGVEARERHVRAQTAHEIELGFPAEFNAMQRREAGDAFARELVSRYGCAVDIAYHTPSKDGDERNFHAHIMFTQRSFDPARPDGWAKGKYRDLAPDTKDKATGAAYLDAEGKPTTRGQLEILDLRAVAGGMFNDIAERDGLAVRTEHLSFKKRGLDREPTEKMGANATDMERRGQQTERGDRNREIETANDNREKLKEAQNVADLKAEREKRDMPDVSLKAAVRAHPHYATYSESVEARQAELTTAREKLERITITQRLMGKRREFVEEIEARQMNLADARQRLDDLTQSVQSQTQGESIEDMAARSKKQAETAAREAAEREREAEQYQRNVKEVSALTDALASRSTSQRILGAISGKSAEARSRIAQLTEEVKSYEAHKRQEEVFTARRGREQVEDAQKKKEQSENRDNLRVVDAAEERRKLQADIDGAQAAADMNVQEEKAGMTPEEKRAASLQRFNEWAETEKADEQDNTPDSGLEYD